MMMFITTEVILLLSIWDGKKDMQVKHELLPAGIDVKTSIAFITTALWIMGDLQM